MYRLKRQIDCIMSIYINVSDIREDRQIIKSSRIKVVLHCSIDQEILGFRQHKQLIIFEKLLIYYQDLQSQRPISDMHMSRPAECFTPISKRKQNQLMSTVPEAIEQEEVHSNFLVKNFQGDTKYTLNYINSIYLNNGKIYNLLERSIEKKSLKCGCVKSYCQAKYCQCFRSGQACGDECSCRDCRNKKSRKNVQPSLTVGCKCRKSGCSKKYCECFQNNKKCGSQCQCTNCCNGE